MALNHLYPVVPQVMHATLPAIIQITATAVDQITSQRDELSDRFYDMMSANGFDNEEFDDLVRLIAGHLNIEYLRHMFNPQNPGSIINDSALEIAMWRKSAFLTQMPHNIRSMYSEVAHITEENVRSLNGLKAAINNSGRSGFAHHDVRSQLPHSRAPVQSSNRPAVSRQSGILSGAADAARFQARSHTPNQEMSKEVEALKRRIQELESTPAPTEARLPVAAFKTLQPPRGGEMDRAKHRIKTVSAMIDVSPSKYQGYLRAVHEQVEATKTGPTATVLSDTLVVAIRKAVPSINEACYDAQQVLEDEVSNTSATKTYNVVLAGYNVDAVEPTLTNVKGIYSVLKHSSTIDLMVENLPKVASMLPSEQDADVQDTMSTTLQAIDAAITRDLNDYIRYALGLDLVIGYMSDWLELLPYLRGMPGIDAEGYISAMYSWINIQIASILEDGAWDYSHSLIVRRNVKVAALRVTLDELGLDIKPEEPFVVCSTITPVFHSFVKSLFDRDSFSVRTTGCIYISLRGTVILRAWRYLKEPGKFVIHRV